MTDEREAAKIIEETLCSGLWVETGGDVVEDILSSLSESGFYVVHESEAPSWMVRTEDGHYRIAGPDEEI